MVFSHGELFLIQVNRKLYFRVQSIRKIVVYGSFSKKEKEKKIVVYGIKCTFKKFMM